MSSDLTRLRVYERRDHQPPYAKCFRAAVSMRCHTSHSRESLTFIPHYARRRREKAFLVSPSFCPSVSVFLCFCD